MEHFSRAVTDDAFTAELLREATNCDVLSLCVRMYICIYVYPSHSTRDTLIAQLPTVCRRRAWQLGSTLNHHWLRIGSLYHSCMLHSALSFTQSRAKWLLTRPPFWMWSLTSRGLGPYPREHAQHLHSTKQDLCLNMWVSISLHVHPMWKTTEIFSLLFNRDMHKNGTEPARVYMCFCVTDQHYYAC